MRTLLGLILSFCAVPALAFNPACFCTRKTDGSGIQQYQTVRFDTPACARERYKPARGSTGPWDDGIKQCVSTFSTGSQSAATMRRCFCTKHVGGTGIQAYRVVKMELPECRTATYKENGVPAWDRVLTCDAWRECYKADYQCQARLKQLTSNLTADPSNAVRTSSALQAQSVKCQSITNDCYVKGLGN